MRQRSGETDKLFHPSDLAAGPVAVKRLKSPRADALMNPTVVEDDFTFFTGILTVQVLT